MAICSSSDCARASPAASSSRKCTGRPIITLSTDVPAAASMRDFIYRIKCVTISVYFTTRPPTTVVPRIKSVPRMRFILRINRPAISPSRYWAMAARPQKTSIVAFGKNSAVGIVSCPDSASTIRGTPPFDIAADVFVVPKSIPATKCDIAYLLGLKNNTQNTTFWAYHDK